MQYHSTYLFSIDSLCLISLNAVTSAKGKKQKPLHTYQPSSITDLEYVIFAFPISIKVNCLQINYSMEVVIDRARELSSRLLKPS